LYPLKFRLKFPVVYDIFGFIDDYVLIFPEMIRDLSIDLVDVIIQVDVVEPFWNLYVCLVLNTESFIKRESNSCDKTLESGDSKSKVDDICGHGK
jgi:hypothetical protein